MQKKIKILEELQKGIEEMRDDLNAYLGELRLDEDLDPKLTEREKEMYTKICNKLKNIISTLNKFI